MNVLNCFEIIPKKRKRSNDISIFTADKKPHSYFIRTLFQNGIINIFRDKKKKSGNRDDYWTFLMVRVTGVEPAAS